MRNPGKQSLTGQLEKVEVGQDEKKKYRIIVILFNADL